MFLEGAAKTWRYFNGMPNSVKHFLPAARAVEMGQENVVLNLLKMHESLAWYDFITHFMSYFMLY